MRAEFTYARESRKRNGDAVEKRHRRTHRDEHIHIGGPVAQRLKPTDVVIPADIKLHRCRQREHQTVYPRSVCPAADNPKISAHAEQEKRQCENHTDSELQLLSSEFLGARRSFRVCINNVKAEGADFVNNSIFADRIRIKGDSCLLCRDADICGQNALHLFQMPCDESGAVLAMHPGDGEIDVVFHGYLSR